ncbi:D-aminoacyl-tRNA deacylase [Geoglobus ahangari]
MKLIVCSRVDPASQNIKNALLSMGDFERKVLGDYEFFVSDSVSIVDVDVRLIYADGIDEKLLRLMEFDEILFASRHSSKDGRKIVTTHCTGNVGRADFGGKPYSLAKPSPLTMKNFSMIVERKLRGTEYEFTLEATHHGPSEIRIPSAFYEIGSTEEEWSDEDVAWIVAESMLEAIDMEGEWKVAVGVGGTHYVPRQTEIELSTVYAFAHNFPKYTFQDLNEEFLEHAFRLSEADVFIIDEKSANSAVKSLVSAVAERLGVEVLKSKHAKKHQLDI